MPADETEKVYTFEDLKNWNREDVSLAVIGCPITHSLSPVMQNAALAEISKKSPAFSGWKYFRFEIEPGQIGEALPVFSEKNFAGLNLTLPHKVVAFDLVSEMSPEAQSIGAVNTLARRGGGWFGHNTDGRGFAAAVAGDLQLPLRDTNVILLGAGGAARAIAAAALSEGCRSLHIGNRDPERLRVLLAQSEKYFPEMFSRVRGFDLASPPADLPAPALVVNATSLGLKPGDGSPFPAKMFAPGTAVYDTIYEPAETAFLKAARAAGLPAANGLSMLCRQGALAFEFWTGLDAPVAVMAGALKKSIARANCAGKVAAK